MFTPFRSTNHLKRLLLQVVKLSMKISLDLKVVVRNHARRQKLRFVIGGHSHPIKFL